MKLHEYQAKALMAQYGVPIPRGQIASTPSDAQRITEELGGRSVIKAQVHAGARGKAGGIIPRQLPSGSRRRSRLPPRQATGHHPDRPRRRARPPRANRADRRRCQGALPRHNRRPHLSRPRRHCLRGRWHGHRRSRQHYPRKNPARGRRPPDWLPRLPRPPP